jgi:hypothetical protein
LGWVGGGLPNGDFTTGGGPGVPKWDDEPKISSLKNSLLKHALYFLEKKNAGSLFSEEQKQENRSSAL